jgi:hypothetical protein
MTDPVLETVEAQEAVVTVEFNGETFKLPLGLNEADADVLIYIEEEKPSLALKALLGEDQFAKYRATRPTVKQHGDFIGKCFEALGTDSGK